jgi:hypothetical protein
VVVVVVVVALLCKRDVQDEGLKGRRAANSETQRSVAVAYQTGIATIQDRNLRLQRISNLYRLF